MLKIAYLLYKGLELLFLLPTCMLSKRVFNKVWNRFYVQPLPKNMFNICVQWLLYCGQKTDLTYEKINVLIFCVIWPIITVASLLLNILLLTSR